MSAVTVLPNVYVNRHPSAKRLGVQQPEGAGLNMLLGRLGGVPNTKPTERAVRRVYRLCLPERDATARLFSWALPNFKLSTIGISDERVNACIVIFINRYFNTDNLT